MNIGTTLTTLAAIVAGSLGIDSQGQTAIKATIAAAVALVVAVHSLVTYLGHRHANSSAVAIAQARAAEAAAAHPVSTPAPAPAVAPVLPTVEAAAAALDYGPVTPA